jgi:LCP family protein required for cell wall assembly
MAAPGEKPYRVYRGGRTKGKVPLSRPDGKREAGRSGGGASPRRARRRWTWKRWLVLVVPTLILLLAIWTVAGYVSVRSGVSAAHKRLPAGTASALTHQNGLIIDAPTNILLLGTDHATNGQAGRSSDEHSDSMMLLRTDPHRHRLVYLSIPRDLRQTIPGYGDQKINAAMQIGGPKLAVQTVDALLGADLPINHVVVVDFGAFEKLIDALGGVTIDVPENILSNRFDCPYSTQARCQQWPGWRFDKGLQHLSGHQALIYSRIRENQLNPADTDITRGEHQQQVMQAALSKLASVSTFLHLPFDGSTLLAPIATDLSTWDFMQLGWVKFRAGSTLHCRLGGTAADIGGGSYIIGTQENISVIQEVLGNSAPQPPSLGGGAYAPGCVTGSQQLK